MGVKISGATKPTVAVQEKPTFESTEEAPAPVKKKVAVTKPDIDIPDVFATGNAKASQWKSMDKAPKDKVILIALLSPTQPNKWDYREAMWFGGPHGFGWYVVGAQWHSLNPEQCMGWMEDVGHP
jgi:hypothetical protein